MNVLVVDNKSAHLERLRRLLHRYIPDAVIRQYDPREITDTVMAWSDIVIISGGQGRSVVKNPGTFRRLVEKVERHNKPCIGICLGAEALGVYFGATLKELPVRRVGNVLLRPVAHDIAIPKKGAWVYEFHKWVINIDTASDLRAIATSKDGVEIFRHTDYPIWGMQFHPEVLLRGNVGQYIFGVMLAKMGIVPDMVKRERQLAHYAYLRATRLRTKGRDQL